MVMRPAARGRYDKDEDARITFRNRMEAAGTGVWIVAVIG